MLEGNRLINPRVQLVDDSLINQYTKIDSSTLGHLTDDGYIADLKLVAGHAQQPSLAIDHHDGHTSAHFAGNIITVKLPFIDGSPIRDALIMSQAGDVLVIDMQGQNQRACWGELRTLAALTKGLAGVITSGYVTDIDALRALNLPIFAAGVSAITTRNTPLGGEVNSEITLSGVTVKPGYLALGDADGLFILNPSQASHLIEDAVKKQQADAARGQEMRLALYQKHPQYAAING